MIHFNRLINPFYGITIDLDNTLYHNDPIIFKAEEKLFSFLKQYHPALSKIKKREYLASRNITRLIDPEIYHDVNHWRWIALERILLQSGLSKHDAELGADSGVEVLLYWRNKIIISNNTYKALSILSSRWPLIAITNGNANPIFCGLQKYFIDVLRSGCNGRAKPYKDMYILASKRLGLSCKYILHIGDDLYTDVKGSIQVGMQSCWMNKYCINSCNFFIDKRWTPHLEISELMSLTCLL